jgi:hypothetical protein
VKNLGRDRGCATVAAAVATEGQGYIHRVLGPGKTRAHPFGLERVAQGARGLAINAGAGDSVYLRGLTIEGISGASNGILFNPLSRLL